MNEAALAIKDLAFSYAGKRVLQLESLSLNAGETCAVLGPSGSGKTTLLHLIAGLLTPVKGTVTVCGRDMHGLGPAARDRFRGCHLGIVFQRLHLLPALNVLDNLLLAQQLARQPRNATAARQLLSALGVGELAHARTTRLSQGQAQRVAIARAMVHRPALLIADEPTSSLDDANARAAIDLLKAQAQAIDAALVVVTHDRRIQGSLGYEVALEAP